MIRAAERASVDRSRLCSAAGGFLALSLLYACSGRPQLTPLESPSAASARPSEQPAPRGGKHRPADASPTPTATPSGGPTPTATPSGGPTPTPSPTPTATPAPPAKIQHVVIVIQENRSFDNLFQGYPGADTVSSGVNSLGQTVPLGAISLRAPYDINHFLPSYLASFDGGKMDGFDRVHTLFYGPAPPGYTMPPNPQYGYVPQSESQPYFNIANQYVLADRMFASQLDGSFVAHQYLIAAQAGGTVNLPSGTWGCNGPPSDTVSTLTAQRTIGRAIAPCFSYPTLASEIEAKGGSWRFYAPRLGANGGFWSAFQAISYVRNGPEWTTNVVSPETKIASDVQNGTLASVTWVVPSLRDSDHASAGSKAGPAWVTSVVNAIGASKFWNTTAIFVVWDDWGGWYDHVPPPQLDYDGLGFRVPMLIVSPYAKHGFVSHTQYEFGSVLRFAEDTFGLGTMSASDARATDPAVDCFDFTQPPRPYQPFASPLSPSYFANEPPSARPPDEE